MMAIAMYAAIVAFAAFGADPLWMLLPVGAAFFAFGYGLQRGLINRFIDRPEHSQFMLLLAVALIMVNGLLLAFGPDARNVQVDYALDSYEIGPLLVDKVRVICAAVALLCCALLFAIFRFTGFGKAIRACADNLLGAQVVGLNVSHLYGLTFGLGAACVGIAGCLLSLLVDVTPASGPAFTLLAFVIVIIGGLGSMVGALAGGVLIGVSESVAGLLIAPSMKSMFSFALLILVLAFRPQGLFSRR
jgi:branched-chain amino acid transport system permease protein